MLNLKNKKREVLYFVQLLVIYLNYRQYYSNNHLHNDTKEIVLSSI